MGVISQAGKRVKESVVETHGAALVEAIRVIPGRKHLVFEEGTQSAWLYEILEPHVDEIVVAGVTERRERKWDSLDAFGLAEQLRTGSVERQVFKAPREFSVLRELARVHETLGRDLIRAQSRLKSVYRSRGISTPGSSVYGQRHREEWTKRLPPSTRRRVVPLYAQLDFLVELKKQAESNLLSESKKHPIIRVLRTAPGIGPIRAAQLASIVVTPHRFRTRQQFWSYSGLGIVVHSTSDWIQARNGGWMRAPVQQTRGLSRQYNRTLKSVFKGAATTVITQRSKDPIYADYDRMLDSGIKPNLAKLTLARKIAATVLRMWKNAEEYQPEKYRQPIETDRDS
jgi:transposase